MAQDSADCLSENEILAWAAGRLSKERILCLDDHVDSCALCQALVGEALRGSGDVSELRPREVTFAENELLAGRYRVIRFLARGGMGEVYEVKDLWLKDTIALKTLVAPIADDPTALARLKAEVLVARSISHPNVCRVFDFGFHEKRPRMHGAAVEHVAFLTMELLRGETLRARLRRLNRFNLQDARPIALQMVAGMAHAHAAGIVHRDFKSDNVMLVEDPDDKKLRVVITDFGLARSSLIMPAQPLTSNSQKVLGTLDYMAPEQVEGKPSTEQSDIYALGVVLFEMMTGQLPFDGDSFIARALRRVQADAPRPSSIVHDIDASWERAIAKCLARNPRERLQSVDQLVPLLERSSSRSTGRLRRRAWLAVGLGVTVIATVAFALRSSPPAGPSPAKPAASVAAALPERKSPAAPVASAAAALHDPHAASSASVAYAGSSAPPEPPSRPTAQRPRAAKVQKPARVPSAQKANPGPQSTAVGATGERPAADRLLDPFGTGASD